MRLGVLLALSFVVCACNTKGSSPSANRFDRVSRASLDRAAADPQSRVLLTYHGGPVLSHVKVRTVFWGNHVLNPDAVNGFYKTIVDSPYVDWLSEYRTPTQSIGRGELAGSYVDTSPPSGDVSDDDVAGELARLIDGGQVPQPDDDTLFVVHFPPGITVYLGPYPSCGYLGYHSAFAHHGREVWYAVMPDCYSDFDTTTAVAGHELLEAITDPFGTGDVAWNDDYYGSQGEISDLCGSTRSTVAGYDVLLGWSNNVGACVSHVDGVPPQPGPTPPAVGEVRNGDFETGGGLAGWTTKGVTFARYYQPHAGRYSARVGTLDAYDGESAISQTVTLPSGPSSLHFYYEAHCTDTIQYDQQRAEIRDTSGHTLKQILNVCEAGTWKKVDVDLTPWAGRQVVIYFGAVDDDYEADPSFLLVDDVAMTTP
jgi:hypothetical protein